MRDRTYLQRNTLSGFILMACLLAACGDGDAGDPTTGTLIVPFILGNDRLCDALGVKSVRAELNDMAYVQEAPCTAGQVRFVGIPSGTYKVAMFGVDDTMTDIMDNFTAAPAESTVVVSGNDTTTFMKPAVTLTAAPAHLWVTWDFGKTTCSGVGIVNFDVRVWRGSGDTMLLQQTLDCIQEGEGVDNYREILDPDRKLTGDDSGEVSVTPYDKNLLAFQKAVVFKFRQPGSGHDIKVTLDCRTGYCEGSGAPDR